MEGKPGILSVIVHRQKGGWGEPTNGTRLRSTRRCRDDSYVRIKRERKPPGSVAEGRRYIITVAKLLIPLEEDSRLKLTVARTTDGNGGEPLAKFHPRSKNMERTGAERT